MSLNIRDDKLCEQLATLIKWSHRVDTELLRQNSSIEMSHVNTAK